MRYFDQTFLRGFWNILLVWMLGSLWHSFWYDSQRMKTRHFKQVCCRTLFEFLAKIEGSKLREIHQICTCCHWYTDVVFDVFWHLWGDLAGLVAYPTATGLLPQFLVCWCCCLRRPFMKRPHVISGASCLFRALFLAQGVHLRNARVASGADCLSTGWPQTSMSETHMLLLDFSCLLWDSLTASDIHLWRTHAVSGA